LEGEVIMVWKYLIEGSEVSQEEAVEYFVTYSGFSKGDAENVFSQEDPEFLMDNCSELEIIQE